MVDDVARVMDKEQTTNRKSELLRAIDALKQEWLERAVASGRVIGLSAGTVHTAFAIVFNALGNTWLDSEAPKSNPKRYGGFLAGHPLVRNFQIGRPPQVSAIVELSLYLSEFHTEPRITEVIQRLKDIRQFEGVLLELVVAYRFKKAGCLCSFDPVTAGGVADLQVTFAPQSWIVECTKQRASSEQSKRDALRNALAQALLDELGRRRAGVAVRFTMHDGAHHEHMRTMARVTGDLAEQIKQRPWKNVRHVEESWGVEVKRMNESEDPIPNSPDEARIEGWDLIAQHKLAPRRALDSFLNHDQEDIPGLPQDRLFIRMNAEHRKAETALLRKVKKKLAQTHGDATLPPRLIMVEVEGRFKDLNWETIHEGIAKMFDSHSRLAGVWFWDRQYSSGRYWYEQYLLSNDKGGHAFPHNLLGRLSDLEQ